MQRDRELRETLKWNITAKIHSESPKLISRKSFREKIVWEVGTREESGEGLARKLSPRSLNRNLSQERARIIFVNWNDRSLRVVNEFIETNRQSAPFPPILQSGPPEDSSSTFSSPRRTLNCNTLLIESARRTDSSFAWFRNTRSILVSFESSMKFCEKLSGEIWSKHIILYKFPRVFSQIEKIFLFVAFHSRSKNWSYYFTLKMINLTEHFILNFVKCTIVFTK